MEHHRCKNMGDCETSCGYCRRKSSHQRRCTRCLNVHYCSKACQTMDWIGHKVTCVKLSHTRKKTTRTFRRTSNETLLATNETKGSGKKNETNISKSGGTDIESGKADGESSADGFQLTSDAASNYEAKMKTEYHTLKENIKRELRGNGTQLKEVVVSSVDSENAKRKIKNVESKIWKDEKDRYPSTSTGDCDQKKMSGSVTSLCRCCSLPGCSQKCSRCKEAFYCSKECQRVDWPTHKTSCSKKLTKEEEEKIKDKHVKQPKGKERNQRLMDEHAFVFTQYFRILVHTLYRAARPPGSLQKAIRFARIFFPLHDIVTQFDKIPWEPMFPIFPFMFPPRGGYVLVAFMYRYHEHAMRHGVYLKDEYEKESKVEFYLDHRGDNPFPFFRYSDVKPGGYICLADPVMHLFGDGTVGIRINRPDKVKVLDIEMVMK